MMRNDPLWFKKAILYELHVRAYHDSVGDGMGDFRGLTQKLDYLQDLGVTAIWLLPFYPSPLRDDGYDISDYTTINPDYGNLEWFREFVDAAHARDLRVITELVINHTSDQHPWFQRARRALPGSVERDFYVWSESPEKYREARIIFKDFELSNWTYDQVAKSYYWHRFYSHQPDLNYDNPEVRKAIPPLIDFWFDMGVDGLRLDAVPYLFEREGTNCENLPETHAYLKELRRHVDQKYPDRMLLAEANQWPEDAAAYFGDGDECHMAFHFPVMPRLFMAIHSEDRFPIVDIMQQTPNIPDNCQWAIFLRNHDELTLEMVTDEERDSMYRAYAHDRRARINLGIRRRLAPLLGNNRRRIELMNGLLFSLPGTPVLYYGDEIGMGDNIYLGDRNGVRTPMQWSADRNAGFSRANPQRLYLPIIIDPEYHYEAVNVEAQQGNSSSLLWWNKRLIHLRQQHLAFSHGTIEFLDPHNRKILVFLRRYQEECVMVVANMSRFVQHVELNLSDFDGIVPVELFGSTAFPRITKSSYSLTLGPHSFYWFSLNSAATLQPAMTPGGRRRTIPALTSVSHWEQLFERTHVSSLRDIVRLYLSSLQMGSDTRRTLRDVHIRDSFRFASEATVIRLLLVEAEFNTSDPETFVLRCAFASDEVWNQSSDRSMADVIARIEGPNPGVIYSAELDPVLLEAAIGGLGGQRTARGEQGGELVAWSIPEVRAELEARHGIRPFAVNRNERSNQSIAFGGRWELKMFRRVEEGTHPEIDLGRVLSEHTGRRLTPKLLGGIEYRKRRAEPMTMAVLHEYVPHESEAWSYAQDAVSNFLDRIVASPENAPKVPFEAVLNPQMELPPESNEWVGGFFEKAALMGTRLAELHLVLASRHDLPEIAPEAFSMQYQRGIYQTMRSQMRDLVDLLFHQRESLSPEQQTMAAEILQNDSLLLKQYRPLLERPFHAKRTRCHGNCHLGHVLYTGNDFVFFDFEGNPFQSLGQRRIKRSPFRDVASMLRSIDFAAQTTLLGLNSGRGQPQGVIRAADRIALEPWADLWQATAGRRFLQAYLSMPEITEIIPENTDDQYLLLRIFHQKQLILELIRELQNPTSLVSIPLRRVSSFLKGEREKFLTPPDPTPNENSATVSAS